DSRSHEPIVGREGRARDRLSSMPAFLGNEKSRCAFTFRWGERRVASDEPDGHLPGGAAAVGGDPIVISGFGTASGRFDCTICSSAARWRWRKRGAYWAMQGVRGLLQFGKLEEETELFILVGLAACQNDMAAASRLNCEAPVPLGSAGVTLPPHHMAP